MPYASAAAVKLILEILRVQRGRMRGSNDVSGNLTAVKGTFQAGIEGDNFYTALSPSQMG